MLATLGYKKQAVASILDSVSLKHIHTHIPHLLVLGEASCHVLRTFRQPCGKARGKELSPAHEELRRATNKCVSLEADSPASVKPSDD